MSSIAYRKDIDGLRALAVLSVVIFHINSSWLPGGFLGVDIFFVISGYLITSIIYKQNKQGVFSFVQFYNRRIKRILPLFFVVLISGVLLSWLLYVPSEVTWVVDSAVASTLFLANLFFARGGDYFHPSSDEKVFLHIWSLSVEEQFYFIFPVVIFLAFKIGFVRKNLLKMVLVL